MKQQYALVTGASMGLGRAFALELASRGYNLILVSLPNEGLEQVAAECRTMGVESMCRELDLTNRGELLLLVEDINRNYDLEVLVNNAGYGGSREFESVPFDYIYGMIQLNVAATISLTHQLLPNLRRQTKGYILNISSMASLIPSGFKTVYPASKAFIRHFSIGLRYELKGSGINVCVAVLGPMPTNSDVTERIESQGALGRRVSILPDYAARCSIDAMLRGDGEVVVGSFNKLMKLLIDLVPRKFVAKMMTRKVKANEIG
ncbi:MAG: SDR family NAD(P)-dependent oxidoreductase [Rikenellaceae bacterium]